MGEGAGRDKPPVGEGLPPPSGGEFRYFRQGWLNCQKKRH